MEHAAIYNSPGAKGPNEAVSTIPAAAVLVATAFEVLSRFIEANDDIEKALCRLDGGGASSTARSEGVRDASGHMPVLGVQLAALGDQVSRLISLSERLNGVA